MPLTRATTTRASQIMLPTDVVFSAALGVTWLLQPPLAQGAALNALSGVWSVTNTALVLLILAVLQGVALATGRRSLESLMLAAGLVVYAALGLLLVVGHSDGASYSAPYWPWYVAVAHLASLVSVVFRENREPPHGR